MAASSSRWLYGPWRDLLVGCGLWYAAAFVLLCLYGEAIRDQGGRLWIPFVTLLVSTPHYGATLVRAYERRSDRRAYTVFTVYATLVLAACYAWGARDPLVGSWILTVYITWSPWHYTGQNYGIAVMFLRRRGVSLDGGVKRVLYAAFGLSYLLTFLALHAGASASHYAPVSYDDAAIRFLPLGFDPSWGRPALAAAALAYAAATLAVVTLLLRRARLADLTPALALMGLQALWFSAPLLLRTWQIETGLEPWESPDGAYYFLWIAIGHAAQYLWVTSYYARIDGRMGSSGESLRYLAKVLLAGAAVWTLPSLLFAPGALGRMPFDAGLAVLTASAVNLHHFILDGAIWKLRDGRVARVLLRSREADPAEPIGPRTRIAPLAWGAGALCFALLLGSKLETELRLRGALQTGDTVSARESLDRLRRIGRDSAQARIVLARSLERRGDRSGALREYQRSIELRPSAAAWAAIAGLLRSTEDWPGVIRALERAIELAPDEDRLHYELGRVLLRQGRPAEARDAFARAVELNPDRGIHRTLLERATLQAGEAGAQRPGGERSRPGGLLEDVAPRSDEAEGG
jgi:tetratricopeptide (TPR) repeat protein